MMIRTTTLSIAVILVTINCFSQIHRVPIFSKVVTNFKIVDTSSFINRIKTVNDDIYNNGIKPFSKDGYDLLTGYSYGEFYDWDLYFENIYLSYFGVNEYCFTNLKAFLKRQHLNGFVSRTLKEPRPYQHFKPFLAQIALLGAKQNNEFAWLNEVVDGAKNRGIAEGGIMNDANYIDGFSYYQRLKKYINYWFWYQDFDKNGLPVWNSADHSGMDNQISRAGKMNEFRYEGIDLACYLYRELKAMAVLAEKLGYSKDVNLYNNQAAKLIAQINKNFWNEKDGFYYDRDEQTGKLLKVKSVAGFLPLFIGAATKQQAERVVKEHLLNKNEFWTDYPIPAYAKSEPDYNQYAKLNGECNWRGATWIPTNYMVFHGLMDYGYEDIAKQLVQKTFDLAFTKNKTTREYYNAETGAGNGLDPFWGWSSLAYLMPFEFEMKYNPTAITKEPIKKIATDNLGIQFKEKIKPATYRIQKINTSFIIDANWDKPQWKETISMSLKHYMGKLPNYPSNVQAKMRYDTDNIYVIFKVTDSYIRCKVKDINGPVWQDNTVEFFFAPDTLYPLKYFNLEINCAGVPLMSYNAVANSDVKPLAVTDIKQIEIAHSFNPIDSAETVGPVTWTLEYKLPLTILKKYSDVTLPQHGVSWKMNLYKIAHKSTNPHYMSWSFVAIKDVDMHTPQFFGDLKFQ